MIANRKSALSKLREKRESATSVVAPSASERDFWDDLYGRIRNGKIVPIIGNAVRHNRIFDIDDNDSIGIQTGKQPPERTDERMWDYRSVSEELAELWAAEIDYPLPDPPRIEEVAKFNRVISDDLHQAKNNYLLFLKGCLLDLALDDELVAEIAEELRPQIIEKSFSDIVAELDYPRFPINKLDPLRVLAKLRLPIYVTTSYYDFLEHALRAEGATNVRTRFCLWNMEPESIAPEHLPDPNYTPSREEPVVYHLHGHEKYPRSLVLSEDDHLDYLLALAQDTNANKPLIPLYLRTALEESSMLLLGYRLQDWDFRILYRGLINAQHARLRMLDRMYSIAIQLDPKYQEGIIDKEKARNYLNDYFKSANFRVEWSGIDHFITTAWEQWNQRRGQL